MLLLNDSTHRLSIDIDIMCPPGTNIEDYLAEYANKGFINYELIERRQAGKDVPKDHSKFFYKVASMQIWTDCLIFFWMCFMRTAITSRLKEFRLCMDL